MTDAFPLKRHRLIEVLDLPIYRCTADATGAFFVGRMEAHDNARPPHERKQRILKLNLRAKDLGIPLCRSYHAGDEEDDRFDVLQHVGMTAMQPWFSSACIASRAAESGGRMSATDNRLDCLLFLENTDNFA